VKSHVLTAFGAPLRAVEAPTPQPQGSEVLLKTLAAGVCHSDLHLADGYYDMGGGKRFTLADRGIAVPITMGHEIAGEIVAVGPDVTGVKPGERYVAYPWIGCGECAVCRDGQEQLCNDARTLGNVGTVVGIAGGVLAIGGAALWYFSPHADSGERLAILPVVSPTEAGFAAFARF